MQAEATWLIRSLTVQRLLNVTMFRSPLLARALYFTGEIGSEIAEQLYQAVVVLAILSSLDKGEALMSQM